MAIQSNIVRFNKTEVNVFVKCFIYFFVYEMILIEYTNKQALREIFVILIKNNPN